MIVTLTPNPSIDRTLTVPEISFNDAIRVQRVRLDWGGKGFNVSRALKEFGIDSIVIAWVGGGSGKMLADGIQSLGIQTDFVWVEGDTRTNTSIIENQSDWRIKANEPGPHITTDDIDQMFLKVQTYAKKGDIWLLSGSLPPDVPEDFYASLIELLKSRGALVYLNANDNALRYGCEAVPYVVKSDPEEAAKIVGFSIADLEDAKRAALPFLRMGISYFALSLDDNDVLLASQKLMVYAKAPKVVCRNAGGAGDALLAGLLYAQHHDKDLVEVARWAVATAAASLETEGVCAFHVDRIQALLPEVDSKIINVL
jgi:1-phosphofructokinase family hexose kinase